MPLPVFFDEMSQHMPRPGLAGVWHEMSTRPDRKHRQVIQSADRALIVDPNPEGRAQHMAFWLSTEPTQVELDLAWAWVVRPYFHEVPLPALGAYLAQASDLLCQAFDRLADELPLERIHCALQVRSGVILPRCLHRSTAQARSHQLNARPLTASDRPRRRA